MTKRFTAIILIANVIMSFLLYLSSQLVLSILNSATLSGFNIFSIHIWPTSENSPYLTVGPHAIPNFPFFVFVVFLLVNAYFIIKLQRDKETKQNLS
jgi:hypothetical protein